MSVSLETELTEENKSDTFICTMCKQKATRGEIRKKWISIPFGKEEPKTYYCGCMGWD